MNDVTEHQRSVWRARGQRIGMTLAVPSCTYSSDQLESLAAQGRTTGYLPPELATRQARHLLDEMFPLMRSYALLSDNLVDNEEDCFGWFDYDLSIDCPHLGTDEASLIRQVSAEGRTLMSLNQYIVASQDSFLTTGRYLDERRTWSRIGARLDGRMVAVRFDGLQMAEGLGDEEAVHGCLLVAYDVGPEDAGSVVGGRTVGAPPVGPGTVKKPPLVVPAAEIMPRPPEDLNSEWQRQAAALIACNYHTALGLTEDQYQATLPKFGTQPSEYKNRFDIPLLVETRIPWTEQARLSGIQLSMGTLETGYTAGGERSAVPAGPYAAWVTAWGQRFRDPIAPADASAQLADDEVGGNPHEVIAMEVAHPGLCRSGRFWDVIGYVRPPSHPRGLSTHIATQRFPCLYHWRGRPEIGANLHPTAFSIFRPLVRGSYLVTFEPGAPR